VQDYTALFLPHGLGLISLDVLTSSRIISELASDEESLRIVNEFQQSRSTNFQSSLTPHRSDRSCWLGSCRIVYEKVPKRALALRRLHFDRSTLALCRPDGCRCQIWNFQSTRSFPKCPARSKTLLVTMKLILWVTSSSLSSRDSVVGSRPIRRD
jgi:hypothetical protein